MQLLPPFFVILLAIGVHAPCNADTPPPQTDNRFKQIEQKVSDSVITTKITAKFTENPALNPLKIRVSTKNGRVTLSGHVNNKEAFVTALRIVKNTRGVRSINVEPLTIQSINTSFMDAYLTTQVEAAVLKAKVFDNESIPLVGINAKTINGMVTLTGVVPNEQALLAIVKRVNQIRGIKKITSLLRVEPVQIQ